MRPSRSATNGCWSPGPGCANGSARTAKGLLLRQRLGDDAAHWHRLGRDPESLYAGARLAIAAEWAADRSHAADLDPLEAEFLAGSTPRAGPRTRLRLAAAPPPAPLPPPSL